MEWTRIEAKWHDMARRLQQGPVQSETGGTAAIDATERNEPNVSVEAVPAVSDDTIARATV